MNSSVAVFRSQFLTTRGTNPPSTITSQPVQVTGNRSVVSATPVNIAGTNATLACEMQGSYDGPAWEAIGTATSQTAFGDDTQGQGSIDYNWMRIEATLSGTDADVIFDATLVFSEQ